MVARVQWFDEWGWWGVQDGDNGGVVVQPAQALAAIETETGDVSVGSSSDAVAKLRLLLEQEIMAQARSSFDLLLPPSHSLFQGHKLLPHSPVPSCAY